MPYRKTLATSALRTVQNIQDYGGSFAGGQSRDIRAEPAQQAQYKAQPQSVPRITPAPRNWTPLLLIAVAVFVLAR